MLFDSVAKVSLGITRVRIITWTWAQNQLGIARTNYKLTHVEIEHVAKLVALQHLVASTILSLNGRSPLTVIQGTHPLSLSTSNGAIIPIVTSQREIHHCQGVSLFVQNDLCLRAGIDGRVAIAFLEDPLAGQTLRRRRVVQRVHRSDAYGHLKDLVSEAVLARSRILAVGDRRSRAERRSVGNFRGFKGGSLGGKGGGLRRHDGHARVEIHVFHERSHVDFERVFFLLRFDTAFVRAAGLPTGRRREEESRGQFLVYCRLQ